MKCKLDVADLRPADVLVARERLRSQLPATPLVRHPLLDRELGAMVYVKLENVNPVGSFKLRGALNLVAQLDKDTRRRGLCAPTRGNHGQSLAYACNRAQVPCTLFVPRNNNREKNTATRALGATVVVEGESFDDACHAATRFAETTGARQIHPGREPALVAGAGTLVLEMLEQAADPLDWLFVPVGVGSCAAGVALGLVAAASTETRLVGVQSNAAPAMFHAFHSGEMHSHAVAHSLADGLAVGEPVAETLAILRRHVDDMRLVDEEEIAASIRCYARTIHQLAEGAGAAALAGALQMRDQIEGQRVGLVLSGGNVSTRVLSTLFTERPLATH